VLISLSFNQAPIANLEWVVGSIPPPRNLFESSLFFQSLKINGLFLALTLDPNCSIHTQNYCFLSGVFKRILQNNFSAILGLVV
jgi:hypothetical protein